MTHGAVAGPRQLGEMMNLEQALEDLGVNTGVIMGIFEHMEIAEEALSAYKARHPEKALEIDCLFPCCQWPSVMLRGAPVALYRIHLAQLIDKLLAGISLDTPTYVEMACMLSGVSLLAPVKYEYLQYLAAKSPEMMTAFGIDDYEAVDPRNPTIKETFFQAFAKVGVSRQREYQIAVKKRTPKTQPDLF